MIQVFVHQITESFRKDVDWIARFGGEEFLIVLPETEVQGAVSLTERLRSSFAQKAIDVPGKQDPSGAIEDCFLPYEKARASELLLY
ncbi:MAG: diguanylate cyclase [Candidatus Scalindua sp.]|nr:diguanylate cyclase [Candidatus Scalindua sp.]